MTTVWVAGFEEVGVGLVLLDVCSTADAAKAICDAQMGPVQWEPDEDTPGGWTGGWCYVVLPYEVQP